LETHAFPAGHEAIAGLEEEPAETPGDVFGAGALVTQEHRRFGDARSVTACRLLVMNREKFLFAVQESPMFAIELLASIDQRLRHLTGCISG
jgi:CRP-like cAMP-binding protein